MTFSLQIKCIIEINLNFVAKMSKLGFNTHVSLNLPASVVLEHVKW